MKQIGKYIAALALTAAASSPADYLDGSERWSGKWRSIENALYCVDVNFAGEMGVTVGGVGIAFGQLQGCWDGKNFSSHSDLCGKGPWTTVEGKVEEDGDTTRVTVSGWMADMTIVETLVAGPNLITYRWQGRVGDPTPELSRISFSGALYTWRDRELNPTCAAVSSDGRRTTFRLRDEFRELVNVERVEFQVGGTAARVEFRHTRNVRCRYDRYKAQIPVRYFFEAKGAAHLTPGAVFSYEIRVAVSPAAGGSKDSGGHDDRGAGL